MLQPEHWLVGIASLRAITIEASTLAALPLLVRLVWFVVVSKALGMPVLWANPLQV